MGKQERVARLLRQLRDQDVDFGQFCVVTEGVFFSSRRAAVIFAEKHDKQLVRVDGQVSGWLAKNRRS